MLTKNGFEGERQLEYMTNLRSRINQIQRMVRTKTQLIHILFLCCGIVFVMGGKAFGTDPVSESSVLMPKASRALFLDIEQAGSRFIAVGERGHVTVSEDGGSSWQQIKVPTRAMLTAVYFIDDQTGWAVGHDSVILKSEDGGLHWEKIYSDTEVGDPLFDIHFFDRQTGIVIGSYGMMMTSSDGGRTWQKKPINEQEDDLHLNHLNVDSSGRCFIAAEGGTIYRSHDKGKSWTTLESPYHGSFFGTLSLESDTLLAYGMLGHLFRSEDAGNSWKAITTESRATLTSACKLADGTITIAGLAGVLLSSSDGGRAFSVYHYPRRIDFTAAVPTADDAFILGGARGCIRLTKEGLKH